MSRRHTKQRPKKGPARSPACGLCTACCTAIEIEELSKPANEPCPHLAETGKGCGIYETRPEPCRNYDCLWRHGQIDSTARPDRIGVLFGATRTTPPAVVARELREGAFDTREARAIIEEAQRNGYVVVLMSPWRDGDRVLGPTEAAEAFKANIATLRKPASV